MGEENKSGKNRKLGVVAVDHNAEETKYWISLNVHIVNIYNCVRAMQEVYL